MDEERLRHSVRTAVAGHPVARARQLPTRTPGRTWCWAIPDAPDLDPVRALDYDDDAALADF